ACRSGPRRGLSRLTAQRRDQRRCRRRRRRPAGADPLLMDTATGSSRQTAADMANAASSWLAELDAEQLPVARWGAPGGEHEDERRLWFYTPTDHGGLAFSDQRDWQQRRAMQ